MKEIRYLTDDRDKPVGERNELVIQQGANGDIYVTTVTEGETPSSGVRLSTSGGASFRVNNLVMGLLESFQEIHNKATKDPKWASSAGITIKN